MTGTAWTASTPIEHAWRGRPDPETPEEFVDWLHAVLRNVREVGYIFHADGTIHYSRFVLRAREAALEVWDRDPSLPDLPPPQDAPTAELLSLWEWAKKALRPAPPTPPADLVGGAPDRLALVRQEIQQLVSEMRASAERAISAAESAGTSARKAKRIEEAVRREGSTKVSDAAILGLVDQGLSVREAAKVYSETTGRKVSKSGVQRAVDRRRALEGGD